MSSSSSQQVCWGYLLHLHQSSLEWAAAVKRFTDGGLDMLHADCFEAAGSSSPFEGERCGQVFEGSLDLCRALAAAAPLPVVCNNPRCENLCGGSEAAAVSSGCVTCHCRYCSAACQQEDWRRHRRACKRMATAGQVCG